VVVELRASQYSEITNISTGRITGDHESQQICGHDGGFLEVINKSV